MQRSATHRQLFDLFIFLHICSYQKYIELLSQLLLLVTSTGEIPFKKNLSAVDKFSFVQNKITCRL